MFPGVHSFAKRISFLGASQRQILTLFHREILNPLITKKQKEGFSVKTTKIVVLESANACRASFRLSGISSAQPSLMVAMLVPIVPTRFLSPSTDSHFSGSTLKQNSLLFGEHRGPLALFFLLQSSSLFCYCHRLKIGFHRPSFHCEPIAPRIAPHPICSPRT